MRKSEIAGLGYGIGEKNKIGKENGHRSGFGAGDWAFKCLQPGRVD